MSPAEPPMMNLKIEPRTKRRAGVSLTGRASQVVIIEAKMVSPIVKNSPHVMSCPERSRITSG